MAYAVTATPMIRYEIGDYTIVWVQSRYQDVCVRHRNTGKRLVGRFQIPSEWQSGTDPTAAQAWRTLRANWSGAPVCRPCADGMIADFGSALAKIDEDPM